MENETMRQTLINQGNQELTRDLNFIKFDIEQIES